MFKSIYILFFIALLLCSTNCAQRFKDEDMMKSHHKQFNPNDDQPLTIHLIQHSHDDVGWLKTVDNYFYGGDTKTQWAGVQYTIDTVVNELSQNQTYKFSFVEVAFLYRWWNQATDQQKDQMKKLVQNKQIQFINGGWCMSDEAAPYYEDVIDQMTIGHRWLKDTFGITPEVAWHIDPFGHQASSASMFSRMGLQSFFFARIDYQDKAKRLNNKGMQMIWHPLQYNNDTSNYIFTHVNYYHYSAVPGFNFDLKFQDQPIKSDPTLQDYNIDTKADEFVKYFRSMALHYRSSNLMHTMGEDFTHANARMWFKNCDKLMTYINNKPEYNMKIIYSTPGQYINSIQQQANKYPKKTDDFFPYADVQHGYWTGYFTSRTALKGFVRNFGKWIQAVRKHLAELKISNTSSFIQQNAKDLESSIWELEMAQGILQHHDGVSGTSKQKVAYDYINTALRAIKKATSIYSKVKSEEFTKEIGETIAPENIKYNIFWNQTAKITGLDQLFNNGDAVLINLYNPGTKGTYEVRLNVPELNLKVVNGKNQIVKGDVICANTYNKQNCQLIMNLPLQQSSNYYIKIYKADNFTDASAKIFNLTQFRIVQKQLNLVITSTASLKMTRKTQQFDVKYSNGKVDTFFVAYKSYDSWQGTGQKSGAYIFRPAIDLSKVYSQNKKIWYAQGTQTTVIVLQNDRTSTKLYFSKISSYIQNFGVEIQTFMDSIPIQDRIGKQVTMSIRTFHLNNGTFYTDSNGLQQQKRALNFRPTWNLSVHEPTAGNYYPINSHIRIQDKLDKENVTIITERSVGGTVLLEGEFELMIHRRLLHDDDRGVDEPLNEPDCQQQGKGLTQSMKHYIVFGNRYREVQRMKDQKIMITYAKSSSKTFVKDIPRTPILKVPSNVKLFLRMLMDDTYLLRLQNMDMSKGVNVTIPAGWTVTELTLSANQLWADWTKKQYKWNEESVSEQDTQNHKSQIIIHDLYQQKTQIINRHLTLNPLKREKELAVTNIVLKPFDLKTYKLAKV